MSRVIPTAAMAGCVLAVLYGLRRAPLRAGHGLATAQAWFAAAGADRAVATLAEAALWLVAAWLGFGLACCLAARLPGAVGAAAGAAGRVLLPRLLLRVVAGSAGLGVLVAPVAAGAAPPPRPTATSAAPTQPGPSWPSEPTESGPPSQPTHPHPPTAPGPNWPAAHPAVRSAPAPVPEPAARDRSAETVRVRSGDSLWLLAAHRLGPHATDRQIAAQWPRWYAANRAVIGPDPDLIVAGEVLHAPTASSQEG